MTEVLFELNNKSLQSATSFVQYMVNISRVKTPRFRLITLIGLVVKNIFYNTTRMVDIGHIKNSFNKYYIIKMFYTYIFIIVIICIVILYGYQYSQNVQRHISQNDKMYSMIEDIWKRRN